MMPTGSGPPISPDDIIVTALRWYEDPWWYRWGIGPAFSGFIALPGVQYDDGADQPIVAAPPADEDSIDIDSSSRTPLTAAEQRAVTHLTEAIAAVRYALNSLPEGQRIRMADGSIVTKEELTQLYSRLDIRVDDNKNVDGSDRTYDNGSNRGEILWNNGDPEFHTTRQNLVGYDAVDGMNYLLLHELGHITSGGRAVNGQPIYQERYGNDVAWAMANFMGWDRFEVDQAFSSYSPSAPTFLGDGGGGGGGGGPHNPGSDSSDPDGPPPITNWSMVVDGAETSSVNIPTSWMPGISSPDPTPIETTIA